MKFFLLFFLVFFLGINAQATDYYVSMYGSDSNNGLSTSTPWKSLNKLNASFPMMNPGDRVLLRRQDIFYGSINVTKSGTYGSPITIGTYGSGAKPVVTGFITVSSWNNLGGNIWESTSAVSSLAYTNMVSVNGENTAMGRWPNSTGPNTGYLTIKSHSGSTSLTTSASFGTDWTGGDVVIRKEKWSIERGKITGQYGSTLNYQDESGKSTKDGYGFFIQNHSKTLDVKGEWYYNPSSKRIRIYSTSTPTDVKVATIQNLVSMNRVSYITFDNIDFEGSNSDAFYCVNYGTNLVIQNCDISYSGGTAVYSVMKNTTVQNNNINNMNYAGVRTLEPNAVIQYNQIKNVNMYEGMENQEASLQWQSSAISTTGENSVIINNKIENCGYSAIKFDGANTKVKNNFINGFCYIKEDGGGIDMSGRQRAIGSVIDGNIILNGVGARFGCLDSTSNDFGGIFIDAYGTGIQILNNTVANCSTIGIKLHGANNIVVRNNTTYNNGGASWSRGGLEFLSVAEYPLRDITVENNIFFAKTQQQVAFFANPPSADTDDIKLFGTSDNNYYAKPIDKSSAILVKRQVYDVSGWKAYSSQDKNSNGAPKSITNLNDLRFEYNASSSPKTIQLDANYIDVRNVSYNGSITLAPYSSAVLMKNGESKSNSAPVANAGSDKTITLPTNSLTLSGSGSDNDGTISSYAWSKLSGPSSTISNSTSSSTQISSLLEGSYEFILKVTDNVGASGYDTVKVVVKAEVAKTEFVTSAGGNQTIILPANTASLNGSSSGGTVSSATWTKISGPSSYSITNPKSVSTTVTDLVEGTYVFELTVSDNSGVKSSSRVQINVQQANGLLPAVNPGNVSNGLNYEYFQASSYSKLPDFSSVSPVKTGTAANFDLSVADREEVYAINFSGYIDVPSDGQYTFYTNSDDGSQLYIDNIMVVNNDGTHALLEKSGTIGLKAGKHTISVGFFQQSIDKQLDVSYAGPGFSKKRIPSSALYSSLLPAVNPLSTVNGIDYKYYEGNSYSLLPNFANLSATKAGTTTNFDLSVANRSEVYAIDYTGYINVPTDGIYTFYTNSDDGSQLYIDNILVVDNDGVHSMIEKSGSIGLKAGKHTISVEFFQASGQKDLAVSYAGPGISKKLIPASALYSSSLLLPAVNPANITNGLNYKYYEANSYTVVPPAFNALNAVKTGTSKNFDVSVANRTTSYSLNFTGYINVPSDGVYTFYSTSDDGSKLYIDNVLVVDNDGLHAAVEKSGTIGLKAGMHALSLGFFQEGGDNILSLKYAGPGISKQVIPETALYKGSVSSLLPALYPLNTVNGLDYKYYEASSYNALPNFNSFTPNRMGATATFDISSASRSSSYSFNFSGYIHVPSDGEYTFYTKSDDGSSLYIDNILVVDNDGLHSALEKSGTIGLKAGKHLISVGYFEENGDNSLTVSYAGPGIEKQEIPASRLYRVSTISFGERLMSNHFDSQNDTLNSRFNQLSNIQKEGLSSETAGISVFPNPFNNLININVNEIIEGDSKLVLMDATGKVLWMKNLTKAPGSYHDVIYTASYARGIYFLNYIKNNKSTVIKLVK